MLWRRKVNMLENSSVLWSTIWCINRRELALRFVQGHRERLSDDCVCLTFRRDVLGEHKSHYDNGSDLSWDYTDTCITAEQDDLLSRRCKMLAFVLSIFQFLSPTLPY